MQRHLDDPPMLAAWFSEPLRDLKLVLRKRKKHRAAAANSEAFGGRIVDLAAILRGMRPYPDF